jgi:hypothetical protein
LRFVTYSRPRTSNDNPFSEALFRTCKYCPAYPTHGFASLAQARDWMQQFVQGYNQAHRHSGIRFVTPEQRHQGLDEAILANRQAVYAQAKARHPERWSGLIRNWQPVTAVWLNPSAEVLPATAPNDLAPLDKLSVEGEAFQKTPTVTVTRSASHRYGWLPGAGGIPTN